MSPFKYLLVRAAAVAALATGIASAYPLGGTLSVLGPSDFVGLFTISPSGGGSSVSGYGGGFTSTLNGSTAMMFCVDFSNDVSIPDSNVKVNISTVTNGSNLTDTRFGNVPTDPVSGSTVTYTYWRPVSAVDSSLSSADQLTIDKASALQRYQMAAYLVSNYSFYSKPLPTGNVYNSGADDLGIQSAIWAIMDAQGEAYSAPTGTQDGSVDKWLHNAAVWLNSGSKSLLSNFEIVSDACIPTDVGCSHDSSSPLNRGIQEFLVDAPPSAVPEPSFYGALAFGLGALVWRSRRERKARTDAPTQQ